MNEKSSIQDLLNQLRNSNFWVRKIVAEYLGASPDDVVISVKKEEEK